MTIFIGIALFFLAHIAYAVVKESYTRAKDRHDEQIMAAYFRQEEARAHARNLAAIERTRRATVEELLRVAAQESGEVINGTAIEVEQ